MYGPDWTVPHTLINVFSEGTAANVTIVNGSDLPRVTDSWCFLPCLLASSEDAEDTRDDGKTTHKVWKK